jgi:hypothetical protein
LIFEISNYHDWPFQYHRFNFPWLPILVPPFQLPPTAHFSTTISTSPDCPFQYHHVNFSWLVLTNHDKLTWLSHISYYCRDHS